jgi:hypothetical protein
MADDDFFALPAFKPAEALLVLKRNLRDTRALTERGNGFEIKGLPVMNLSADEKCITAQLTRSPSRSPQWDRFTLASSPEVRRFTDEVKKRLARWAQED